MDFQETMKSNFKNALISFAKMLFQNYYNDAKMQTVKFSNFKMEVIRYVSNALLTSLMCLTIAATTKKWPGGGGVFVRY